MFQSLDPPALHRAPLDGVAELVSALTRFPHVGGSRLEPWPSQTNGIRQELKIQMALQVKSGLSLVHGNVD